ncbi:MAG: hypothetical protein M1587_04515 [Thaumarchaeota archaeon]|nr:hypothetical protein [Nitrososphaerota archaeon]
MTLRKDSKEKPVTLDPGLHKKLKLICFDHDLFLHDLVNALLQAILADEEKVSEVIAGLE